MFLLQRLASLLTAREWMILITAFVAGMVVMLVAMYIDLYVSKKNRHSK